MPVMAVTNENQHGLASASPIWSWLKDQASSRRANLVVRGPDVAPAVKSLEGYPPPMAFHRWASGGSAVSSPMRAWILRFAAAAAPRISVRTMIQVIGGFFLPPSLPAWSSTTTVAGPAWESSALACHRRHGARPGPG
jgi:hypothetical protein